MSRRPAPSPPQPHQFLFKQVIYQYFAKSTYGIKKSNCLQKVQNHAVSSISVCTIRSTPTFTKLHSNSHVIDKKMAQRSTWTERRNICNEPRKAYQLVLDKNSRMEFFSKEKKKDMASEAVPPGGTRAEVETAFCQSCLVCNLAVRFE